jgi:phosphoenolpyruvate carboxykinase (ATP)
MGEAFGLGSDFGLENHAITNPGDIYWNLTTAELYEQFVWRQEGLLAHSGPMVVNTAPYTGRSPNDKFMVREASSEKDIWWGKVNVPIDEDKFDIFHHRLLANLQGKDLFVQDCYVGAEPSSTLPIRVITETAWASLFAHNMFRRADRSTLSGHVPQFTVIDVPSFKTEPTVDGSRSEVSIMVNFGKRLILIAGSSYGGEIKKSIFTIMNYILPRQDILSMHCSANVGPAGDVALFFGLSGTGKTSLSADPTRSLIGDDEHGWGDKGIFNFEGGCYAKVIRLSEEAEPQIWSATHRFGTVCENVVLDEETRIMDLNDDSITENTRSCYPLTYIPNAHPSGMAGQPQNVLMLTADAFGVMPPIAKLTPEQAMYHFLSGYTAKVAGTEKGLGSEPQATFSTCFGAPFMALHPSVYANMLGERIAAHSVTCWLVNTGWSGGPYGIGQRIKIKYTRAMVAAALNGTLKDVPCWQDPVFGLYVPKHVEGVPDEILNPRNTWTDPAAYDKQAQDLAGGFNKNFEEFVEFVSPQVMAAGPKSGSFAH